MLLVGLKLLAKSFEINTNITVQSSKSIGIEYRQLLAPKVSAIPQSILRLKTIADINNPDHWPVGTVYMHSASWDMSDTLVYRNAGLLT